MDSLVVAIKLGMEYLNILLQLAWPLTIIFLAIFFKDQIRDLFGRISELEVYGYKIKVRDLNNQVQEAKRDIKVSKSEEDNLLLRENIINNILTLTQIDPKSGLELLASATEENLSRLCTTQAKTTKFEDLLNSCDEKGILPKTMLSALRTFWKMKNMILDKPKQYFLCEDVNEVIFCGIELFKISFRYP